MILSTTTPKGGRSISDYSRLCIEPTTNRLCFKVGYSPEGERVYVLLGERDNIIKGLGGVPLDEVHDNAKKVLKESKRPFRQILAHILYQEQGIAEITSGGNLRPYRYR